MACDPVDSVTIEAVTVRDWSGKPDVHYVTVSWEDEKWKQKEKYRIELASEAAETGGLRAFKKRWALARAGTLVFIVGIEKYGKTVYGRVRGHCKDCTKSKTVVSEGAYLEGYL